VVAHITRVGQALQMTSERADVLEKMVKAHRMELAECQECLATARWDCAACVAVCSDQKSQVSLALDTEQTDGFEES